MIKDESTDIQLATDNSNCTFFEISLERCLTFVNLRNGWTYNPPRGDHCASLVNESKGGQDKGDNALCLTT